MSMDPLDLLVFERLTKSRVPPSTWVKIFATHVCKASLRLPWTPNNRFKRMCWVWITHSDLEKWHTNCLKVLKPNLWYLECSNWNWIGGIVLGCWGIFTELVYLEWGVEINNQQPLFSQDLTCPFLPSKSCQKTCCWTYFPFHSLYVSLSSWGPYFSPMMTLV